MQFSGSSTDGIVRLEQTLTGNEALLISTANNMAQLGGWTAIGDGIQKAHQELSAYGRSAAEWLMIVVADGFSNRGTNPTTTSAAAKTNNPPISIHTVAVTSSADTAGMQAWCTQPSSMYYTYADDFVALAAVEIDAMVSDTCPTCQDNCNSNGACVCGECECAGGWTGEFCELAPMTCADDAITTPEDTAVVFDPKNNDQASGTSFSISSVGNPIVAGSGATTYLSGTDDIRFTPAANWNGETRTRWVESSQPRGGGWLRQGEAKGVRNARPTVAPGDFRIYGACCR